MGWKMNFGMSLPNFIYRIILKPLMKSVGVILLTLNAEKHLLRLLPPLLSSPLKPKILAYDSSSVDQTVPILKKEGIEVEIIPPSEFNHGLTREKGRKQLACDITVFLTQDAYLQSSDDLARLIEPLIQGKAACSYARQIARPGASLFEAFPRAFNYPEQPHIRGKEQLTTWGVYSYFISNSAAAWDNAALDAIGGFKEVLFGEDTVACAELIHHGYKVAYAATALVEHSHDYTLKEEYQRHVAIGQSRKVLEPYLKATAGDQARGRQFAKGLLKAALKRPWLFPYACLHLGAKWLGYRKGKASAQPS
jgi:rhamnosyltransferase